MNIDQLEAIIWRSLDGATKGMSGPVCVNEILTAAQQYARCRVLEGNTETQSERAAYYRNWREKLRVPQ